MKEIWKPIPGLEGKYSVSSLGQVRREAYFLTPGLSTMGYPYVSLRRNSKKNKGHSIHSLVAEAFLGPRPEGFEINHKDCDRTNPVLHNLEYVTHKRNMEYAKELGRMKIVPPPHGELHNKAKLTVKQVEEIRQSTESIITLGKRFGVSKGTISRARTGQNWKTVSIPPKPKFIQGDPHFLEKLTIEDAKFIRQSNEPAPILAEQFRVSKSTICRVRQGKSYSRLPDKAVRISKPGHPKPWTKLTIDQVLAIRAATGYLADIGRRFGISYVAIRNIKQRKSWVWLE